MRSTIFVVLFVLVTCSGAQAPPVVLGEPATFTVHADRKLQAITGFGAGMYQGTITDLESLSPEGRAKAYELVYGDNGWVKPFVFIFRLQPNHCPPMIHFVRRVCNMTGRKIR